MNRRYTVIVPLVLMWFSAVQSSAQSLNVRLDDYVREGLEKNLGFRQQKMLYDESDEAVRQARGAFLPSLTLYARHTELYGNVLDLGSFVNPAYAALNRVTGSSAFPTDLHIHLPFRNETTLQLRMPLIEPKVWLNYQIRSSLREASGYETETKARELIATIKTAYFNYAKTLQVVEVYAKTIQLAEENVRVNQSLVKNDKALPDVLYRAEAELADLKQRKADAERQSNSARQYFNFLLDRPLLSPVNLIPDSLTHLEMEQSISTFQENVRQRREEFRQVQAGIDAAESNVSINTSNYFPNLVLAVDYGFQGEKYDFSTDKDYAAVSLVAQWNIFNGLQDAAKREQAVIESERLKTGMKELENQIALQIQTVYNEANVLRENIAVAEARLKAAEASFRIVNKKYEQGNAFQVTYLDARTAYTNAAINIVLTRYDFFIKMAELERVAATEDLSKYPILKR